MTIRRIAFTFFCITLFASSVFGHGLMKFTVDLRNTQLHSVHVSLTPSGFKAGTAVYQMPIWAPGAYSVTGYGRYVVNFRAGDKNGYELPVKQLNENRWEIPNAKSVKSIDYDVLDSHSDTTSLYFAMANIDTSLFFANATCLFGYYDDDKSADAEVTYLIPDTWKLSCSLNTGKAAKSNDPTGSPFSTNFIAKDYDELADAPILAAPTVVPNINSPHEMGPPPYRIITSSFKEGRANYDVALATDATFSEAKMDSLTEYLQKIVHAETDFFHDTPYDHYTFEIVSPSITQMPSEAQGALEHWNSSDYLLANFGWSFFKSEYLSIFSHEFFHLWNVKRIHSDLLGPFDYTKRVMTTSLWMAEGITEYYAHTLLARYGIIRPGKFYSDMEQWRKEMNGSPDYAKQKSLEQLSIDESGFDLDEALLFYSKGPLVAMMLDIEIRNKTNNKKSLDDVMLALNEGAKKGETFREDQLINIVEKYAGVDLTDFYNRYIHGTDSLPIDRYLAMMGVGGGEKHDQMSLGMIGGKFVMNTLDSGSSFARAGIKAGDFLIAMNGTKLTLDNIEMFSTLKDSLPSATITIEREGQTMEIPVTYTKTESTSSKHEGPMDIDPNATPLANEIRKGIVGE